MKRRVVHPSVMKYGQCQVSLHDALHSREQENSVIAFHAGRLHVHDGDLTSVGSVIEL